MGRMQCIWPPDWWWVIRPCPNIRIKAFIEQSSACLWLSALTPPTANTWTPIANPFWKECNMAEIARHLFIESEEIKTAYN
jgi:hypothetical protein